MATESNIKVKIAPHSKESEMMVLGCMLTSINSLNIAAAQAFNLAFNITYVTKGNIKLLIGKAFRDSKAIGLSQNIMAPGIIEDLLAKAQRSMLSLKSTANLE